MKAFVTFAVLGCLAMPTFAQETETEAPAGEPFAFAYGEGWENTFELGLTGTSGNTDNFNLYAQYRAFYEDEAHRWDTYARYNRGETEGEINQNEVIVESIKDWFFDDSDWGAFVNLRYENDELEAWEHQVAVYAGVSNRLVQTDEFDLLGRVGVGTSRRFDDPNPDYDEWQLEALAGLVGEWRIDERQTFDFGTTIYPNLSESGHFRAVAEAGYSLAIDASKSLRLGANWQYDSRNTDPVDKDQVNYFATFVYQF